MKNFYIITFSVLLLALISCNKNLDVTTEILRETEKSRLNSLVEADMKTARAIHADDFQLITPSGRTFTKEQYLKGISSGNLDYKIFRPESEIKVKIHKKSAIIRYISTIEITVGDKYYPPEKFWHTDTYEFRDGRWQAVWSQATTIIDDK